jgi:hypothetical protein
MKKYYVTVPNSPPFGSGYYRVYAESVADVKVILQNAGVTKWNMITDNGRDVIPMYRRFLLEIRKTKS